MIGRMRRSADAPIAIAREHRALIAALLWGAFVAYLVLGSIWSQPGTIDYVDVNVPATFAATLESLTRFSSAWDWYSNMGRPNPSFLSEQTLLGAYAALQLLASPAVASKLLLWAMVFTTYCGCFSAIRRARGSPLGSVVGATFFCVNPWYFDEIAQGHIYLLMSAWAVPIVIVLFVQRERWTRRDSLLGFAAVAYIVAIDFRFAMLVYFAAFVGLCFRLGQLQRSERVWRACALIAAPLLILFVLTPYFAMIGALRAGNTPVSSSFGYYSNFTSFFASLTLVRPNYDAIMQVERLGVRGEALWWLSDLVLFVAGIRALIAMRDNRLRGTLLTLIGTGVILGSGGNPPFGPLNAFLHETLPLYRDLFRDPSKFFVLQAASYALVLGMVRPPALLENSGIRRFRDLALGDVKATAGTVLAGVASAVVFAYPFLALDYPTIASFDAERNRQTVRAVERAENEARDDHTRFAMVPPGIRALYRGSDTFVYDPLALFPTVGNVRIPVDYDFDASSLAARWALGAMQSAQTDVAGSMLQDVGVSRLAYRDVQAQYDLAVEESALRPISRTALKTSADLTPERDAVYRTEPTSLSLGADRAAMIAGDRSTVNLARTLRLLPSNAIWCFSAQCPATNDTSSIAALTDAPPGTDVALAPFGVADYGGHWIIGTIAWAELNLTTVRPPEPSIVGFVGVQGSADVALPAGRFDVWMRVLNTNVPTKYELDGLSAPLVFRPRAHLDIDGYAWVRLGEATVGRGMTHLKLIGKGSAFSVAGLRFVSKGARSDARDAYVGHLDEAVDWSRPNAFIVPRPGAANRSLVVTGGGRTGMLRFATSVPDGRWQVSVRGNVDRTSSLVEIAGRSRCRLRFRLETSTQRCAVDIAGGAFELDVRGGVFAGDAVSLVPAAAPFPSDRLQADRIPFDHDRDAFTLATGRHYRFVAVKIADANLWQPSCGRCTLLGTSFGYGMLLRDVPGERVRVAFKPSSLVVPSALASLLIAAILVTVGYRRGRRSRLRVSSPSASA